MRTAIRTALLDNIKELKNCYESNVANKEAQKPYAVLVDTNLYKTNDDKFLNEIEIFLYEKRTTFKNLDKLKQKVIKLLDEKTLPNTTYTCTYKGMGMSDMVIDDWDCIACSLRFEVTGINIFENNQDDNVSSDDWVEAISKFTESIFKDSTVYRDYTREPLIKPSVLIRVENINKNMINGNLFDISKDFKVHIFSDNKKLTESMINILTTQILKARKIILDADNRRYILIKKTKVNKDDVDNGQISFSASRKEFIYDEIDSIEYIHMSGKLR